MVIEDHKEEGDQDQMGFFFNYYYFFCFEDLVACIHVLVSMSYCHKFKVKFNIHTYLLLLFLGFSLFCCSRGMQVVIWAEFCFWGIK